MYNPSRGGVRGGADQFTWESVKSDKHRENYLGHSLKAPVGRWQKGKDLSWYAKERKDAEEQVISDKSELAKIKQAEEEAMLIALGQKVIRKESQSLSKEEMKEALKRNTGERDNLNVERVGGVGSGRRNLLAGISSRPSNEGVTFETVRNKDETVKHENDSPPKKSKKKEKSKKCKKEKKCKKSHRNSDSEDFRQSRKHKRSSLSPERRKSHKKSKHRSSSSSSESDHHKSHKRRKHKLDRDEKREMNHSKRQRHDTSESE